MSQPCEVYLALLEVRQSTWLLKGRQIHEVNGSGWSLLDVLAIGLFNTKQAFSKKTFYSRGQSSLQMGMGMISEVRQRTKSLQEFVISAWQTNLVFHMKKWGACLRIGFEP